MTTIIAGISSIASSAGGAAATAASSGAGILGGGSALASILQGTATVLSVASQIRASNADASALEAQARDAEHEKILEGLQETDRKIDIKRATLQALGERDVAYAASGIDLSFGTAAQARKEAIRQSEVSLATNGLTTQSRQDRLDLRASEQRIQASRVRSGGLASALASGAGGIASILRRR